MQRIVIVYKSEECREILTSTLSSLSFSPAARRPKIINKIKAILIRFLGLRIIIEDFYNSWEGAFLREPKRRK